MYCWWQIAVPAPLRGAARGCGKNGQAEKIPAELFKCLRLTTIPAVHCNAAAKGFSLESRTNSTHPTSGPAGHHPIRKRNSRSMCADFAAHGRSGCPTEVPLDRCHTTPCHHVRCKIQSDTRREGPAEN